MAYLTINDPLMFTEKIYKTEEEDYITAELENEIKAELLNNDVFLKTLIEEKEKAHLYSKKLEEADLLTVQENGTYYVKYAQNAPDERNEGYFKVINHPQKMEGNRIIFWHPCVSSLGGYLNVLAEGRWLGWQRFATLEDLSAKVDKFHTIYHKNRIQDEDLIGSAFTNKSWCGAGWNLEHAPASDWISYLCLDAATTGSNINQLLAMEINGSNPKCYFTNDAKGKKWKQFLFVEDLKERISHPNLLINSDFSNLINTEGKTSYSGKNQYTFDGWMLDSSNGRGTLDKSAARVDLFNNQNSEYIDFTQRLELGTIRTGENYTFSASTQVGKVNVTFTGRTSQSVQITEKLSFIYTAAEKYDAVTLRYTGYSYFVKWAKLEQGLIATKFLPPDRATEIVRCQRYIQKIGGWWKWIATGFVSKTNQVAYFPIILQSKMRDVPTLEIRNKEQIKVMGGNIHTNIVDLEGFQHASENYYNISFTLPENVSVETKRDMVVLYFGENVEFLFRAYL